MNSDKTNLIYFADPMCSTCYGFSPELKYLLQELDGLINLQLVMGGLRPFNTETITQLKDFLKEEWNLTQQLSGRGFKYDILSDCSIIYDTEPASRAVITVQKIAPQFTLAFFNLIQQSFYAENKDITNTSVLAQLAGHFSIGEQNFLDRFNSDEMRKITIDSFNFSMNMGVTQFPTIALHNNEQLVVLSEGFCKAGQLMQRFRQHC